MVDSGSIDDTVPVATRLGAKVVTHSFSTHSRQWQWALQNLPLETDWILALDADQSLTEELRFWLACFFQDDTKADRLAGVYFPRRQIFRGKWIKRGGYYPVWLLKLFRKSEVHIDETETVDHHFFVTGDTTKAQGDLIEDNRRENDIGFWIQKHETYARGVAKEEFRRSSTGSTSTVRGNWLGNPDQRTAAAKRLWTHLPLYIRPFLYFMYRYFLRLGILDGKQGFIFHFLQAFWFRLLVDIHLDDMRTNNQTTDRNA